jgi:hypothetical protein
MTFADPPVFPIVELWKPQSMPFAAIRHAWGVFLMLAQSEVTSSSPLSASSIAMQLLWH